MYRFQDKNQRLKKKKIFYIFLVCFVVLILFYLGTTKFFSGFLNKIGLPIWKTEKVITETVKNNNYIFKSRKSLLKENQDLLRQNIELKISMMGFNMLKNENDSLKEILNRKPESYDLILANILSKPSSSPYDSIVIDIGSDEDVLKGWLVYATGHIPIGRIEEVYKKTSLVSLYSSPKKKTEGLLEDSNITVELLGRGGGNFETILPADLEVPIGAKVVLPGSEIDILALVSGSISDSTNLTKKIILTSPINIQNLKWIEVRKE